MPSRFLRFFRPFTRLMPEAKAPDREVSFKEKLIWTAVVLVIYLIMSNVPLYGINIQEQIDYFYWMRVILASQRGRLTEFGIGPIVTAGLVMQLLVGSRIINVDMSDPVERGLFSGVQKVMAVLLTIAQTIAYLLGGAFGDGLPPASQIMIFFQLFFATMILMMMDELLQKGWGIGSGVSLFIGANVAGQILWNAFSFFSVGGGEDAPARGAIIAFIQSLIGRKDITVAESFLRPDNLPSMLGVVTTVIIFLVVVWFESMRIEIPLSYKGYSGFKGKYPMKLMYVSNIPVILVQALYANILFFAQLIAGPEAGPRLNRPRLGVFLDLIGQFNRIPDTDQLRPVGGIAYYLTPPQGIASFLEGSEIGGGNNPVLHAFIYLAIFMFLCIMLGRIWVEVSGLAPRDIARQILGSKMQIDGFRSSEKVIEKILSRYIPALTIINGIIVGLLSFVADFLGALGSGTGLLLMVGIMQNFAESIAKEAASEQYPTLSGFLGK